MITENLKELAVGQFAEKTTIVTEGDVIVFADVIGDRNPVHFNPEYAAGTKYKECIVHGALLGSYVSALIGMELPGPGSIVISLNLKFRAAVKVGEEVTTRVEIRRIDSRRGFVKLSCSCTVKEKIAVKGEVTVHVPRGEIKTEEG